MDLEGEDCEPVKVAVEVLGSPKSRTIEADAIWAG
jgi:hypothetical protein